MRLNHPTLCYWCDKAFKKGGPVTKLVVANNGVEFHVYCHTQNCVKEWLANAKEFGTEEVGRDKVPA